MLTLERLKELLTYDRSTGEFYWRDDRGPLAPKGSRAGTLNVGPMQGYVRICIDGKIYSAARLVWLYHHGSWPAHQVDHKDRDRANNRLENLREATPKQNMRNSSLYRSNTSGFKGVNWEAARGKWRAQIRLYGKNRHLGLFITADEAHAAYTQAAEVMFGEYAAPVKATKTPAEH